MAFKNMDFKPSPPLYGGRYKASGFIPNVAPPRKLGDERNIKPWKYQLNQQGGQSQAAAPAAPVESNLMDSGPDDGPDNYDNNRRIAAARDLGYEPGQGNIGQAFGMLAGAALGIPGVGFLAEKTGLDDRINEGFVDPDAPMHGDVGSYDHQSGGVFGNTGQAYDPITGRPMAVYKDTTSAFNTIFGEGQPEISQGARDLGVSEGSVAGIRTKKGEDSIQDVLDDAAMYEQTTGSLDAAESIIHQEVPKPTTVTGGTDLRGQVIEQTDAPGVVSPTAQVIGQTSSGDDVHAPSGGGQVVTDRHGNAVTSTNRAGQKVAVTSRPQPEPQRDDSGGGGGGGGGGK